MAAAEPKAGVYGFDVPANGKPGDVCRINLADGQTVTVELPEGAKPGDVIEFSVGGGGASPSPSAAPAAAPSGKLATAKLHWQENASRSQAKDDKGLSNAAVESIYSVELPEGHVIGEPIMVELSPGGAVLCVPVPAGVTRAGDLVLFKPPVGGEERVDVLMKGLLSKRSPKAFVGMHKWQSRWFELQPSHLAYWEMSAVDGAVKKGYLKLDEMIGVRAHQRDPKRLDLLLKSGRMFELKATNQPDRDEWARVMQEALVARASAGADERKAPPTVEELAAMASTTSIRADEPGEAGEGAAEEEDEVEEQVRDARSSMRTVEEAAADDEEAAGAEEDEEEEELTSQSRTKTFQAKAVASGRESSKDSADVVDVVAEPVIVQAKYLSRVERARQANQAKMAALKAKRAAREAAAAQ